MNNDLIGFIQKHGFHEIAGGFTGVYADMCLTLRDTADGLSALLYLDLPKKGAHARKALLALMSEKAERYSAAVSECDNPFVIQIDLSGSDDLMSRLERYLLECDTSLRPYGREMGILCADCRSEIVDTAPVYVERNGFTLPVCPECSTSQSPKARVDNRKTIAKRRARMGMLGALTGMAATAAMWFLISLLGFPLFFFAAIGAGFLVDICYRKFGGINDRWRTWLVSIFAALGVMLGGVLNSAVLYNKTMDMISTEYGELSEQFASMSVNDFVLNSFTASIPAAIFAVIGAIIATRGIKRYR